MEWNCIFFNSNGFSSLSQLPYQQQPLNTLVNSIQTMPVQTPTLFPPIVSSHRVYETAAGTHTDVQPLLSRNQFQSASGTGQSLN